MVPSRHPVSKERTMTSVKIIGMSCGHCVKSVQDALEKLELRDVKVDLSSSQATFVNSKHLSKDAIAKAIKAIGFEVAD